jgi:hypothetical protein
MLLTSEVNKGTIFKEKRNRNERKTPKLIRRAPGISADLLLEGGENDAYSSLQ